MALTSVKGMNDILPQDIELWQFFEDKAKQCLKQFGYSEIRTPIVEHTEVFVRAIGQVTDIVEKEMYSFHDALNGEHLTLRPEGTAATVRSVIQNHLLYEGGKKLWYSGAMFRHERPQRGRYRQFHQLGIECLGFAHAQADIELILFADTLFKSLNINEKVELHLNSLGDLSERQNHRKALVEYFEINKNLLDSDSLKRLSTNPLRILDSKNPAMQEMIEKAPKILDFLQPDSLTHFNIIKQNLDNLNIKYIINSRLVRGLDYYNRTVFEWITNELGTQGTICGGGRYDPLIEIMGGKSSPAVGLAIGIERLLELIKLTNYPKAKTLDAYMIYSGEEILAYTFKVAQTLRKNGLNIMQHSHTQYIEQSFKAQMKKATSSLATFAIIINENNQLENNIQIKNLTTGENAIFNLQDMTKILKYIKG